MYKSTYSITPHKISKKSWVLPPGDMQAKNHNTPWTTPEYIRPELKGRGSFHVYAGNEAIS